MSWTWETWLSTCSVNIVLSPIALDFFNGKSHNGTILMGGHPRHPGHRFHALYNTKESTRLQFCFCCLTLIKSCRSYTQQRSVLKSTRFDEGVYTCTVMYTQLNPDERKDHHRLPRQILCPIVLQWIYGGAIANRIGGKMCVRSQGYSDPKSRHSFRL